VEKFNGGISISSNEEDSSLFMVVLVRSVRVKFMFECF
jgi:hypothetical protein